MYAAIVSHCDASPVFEFSEHVLNFVALFIECCVVFDLFLRFFLDGIHGSIPLPCKASLIGVEDFRLGVYGQRLVQDPDKNPTSMVFDNRHAEYRSNLAPDHRIRSGCDGRYFLRGQCCNFVNDDL